MKNLKLTTYFVLSFLMFSLNSCDNEPLDTGLNNQNNNGIQDYSILGDWRAVSFSANTSSGIVANGMDFLTESSITGSDFDYNINFSNNRFTTNGDYQMRAITELNGQVIDDTSINYTGVTGSGGYSINGNAIVFEDPMFDLSMNGIDDTVFETDQRATYQFSNDGQRLTFIQNEERIQSEGGFEIVVEVTSTTVLERI